jgi:hypothetical protein
VDEEKWRRKTYSSVTRKLAEVVMPHRRKAHKGSFAGHSDDLLKHFSDHRAKASNPTAAEKKPAKEKHGAEVSVHQALLERAGH